MATTNEKIRKQFEFYFSDSNLPHDRYLWNKHKENDGWIPIADVAGFKKIKMLTEDQDAVVAALKEGPLEHIEINETNDKLRRKTPVQQVDHDARSIYAKNIPELSEESADKVADLLNLQDEVQEFFEQYGKVLAVRMRRVLFGVRKGKFKGSVFVEFSTPEEAEKVAAMSLKFKDNDLLLMPK
ncbi:hypothetical protein BC940DRAFT_232995 [Gongronella butleri]|nr:hypothetical protein BC940DRAFT_232995 [Gongronella butleri]